MMYRNVKININSVEGSKSFNNKESPASQKFLVLDLEMKNTNPSYPVILFFAEEVTIFVEKDKTLIKPENYKIENNLDPGQESKGQIWFVVPEAAKKFKLQFAKTGAKSEVDLKL